VATEDVKLICNTKFPAKVLLWLAVKEYGVTKPELAVYQCLLILHKFHPKTPQKRKIVA
jgi:hypothetical protein